jgi:hypothetical protein
MTHSLFVTKRVQVLFQIELGATPDSHHVCQIFYDARMTRGIGVDFRSIAGGEYDYLFDGFVSFNYGLQTIWEGLWLA